MEDYPSVALTRLKEMGGLYASHVRKRIDRYASGESFLLRLLALNNAPTHPSELQQYTCTSSARVAALLGTLEKKGLIAREVDQQDRRRVLVTITDEGKKRAECELAEMTASLEAVFRELGREDTEALVRLLERLFEVCARIEEAETSGCELTQEADKGASAGKTSPRHRDKE
jgi:DNA-binding MarR family transcriptional regulator